MVPMLFDEKEFLKSNIANGDNFELGNVNCFEENNTLWFRLSDIAKVLDVGRSAASMWKELADPDELVFKKVEHSKDPAPYGSESLLYRILNRSNSPKARPFERWITKEVIPTIRRTGKYEAKLNYNSARDRSKKIRNIFTETLKEHGYTKQYEYINTTKAMKKELGITAKKDDMTLQELASVSASEWLSMAMLTDERGYHEVNPVCVKASDAVIGAIEENRKSVIA